MSENALDQYPDLDTKDQNKVDLILKELEIKPYQGSYGQHPLWDFIDRAHECVIWSAEINDEDRLNYLIFTRQNYILVTNLIGHEVINIEYAKRP